MCGKAVGLISDLILWERQTSNSFPEKMFRSFSHRHFFWQTKWSGKNSCHNSETSKHIMLGSENVFLSTKANLATVLVRMQHYCPLISTTTTTDSQLSLLLQLGRLRRRLVLSCFVTILYYLIFSLFTSLLWRSYHKYPCQLSLFQADSDLEDDFQFSSNFHTFRFPSSCISSIINSHFQGLTCWAFAKTPGTARMIVGNNSEKSSEKGQGADVFLGTVPAGGWGPPPVIRVVMGRSIAILFRLVYHMTCHDL